MKDTKPDLTIKNVKEQAESSWQASVQALWGKEFPGLAEEKVKERLNQVVFIIQTPDGEAVGVSTAYKAYIKQLGNYLYAFRCFIAPDFRVPGLTSTLLVKTRDYLEDLHKQEGPEDQRCIGVITLVENERIMQYRREAIWPASKMVYIGNSPKGNHIRVYYFKDATI